MLLDLLFGEKINRGRLTVCVIILLCITLLTRALAIGISLYGFIMMVSDNAISTIETALVNEIEIFGTIRMGHLLKGVVYSSVFVLMPLQMASGLLGFLGAVCKHKAALTVMRFNLDVNAHCITGKQCAFHIENELHLKCVYSLNIKQDNHMIMLCMTMSLLVIYFVLVGRVLHEFYSSVETQFAYEIKHGSERQGLQSKMQCCGLGGNTNTGSEGCVNGLYNEGCWEKWSASMYTFCSTMVSLFALSFCLEVINFVITDYKYRKLRIKEGCSISDETNTVQSKPRDIIGDIVYEMRVYIQRSGALEFICRMFPIITAVLGISMLAYGAACSVDYPHISDPSNTFTNFLIVDDSGLDLSELVTLVSRVLIVVGCLTFTVAILIIVSSCFASLRVLFSHATGLCACILLKTVFISAWIALYIKARQSINNSLRDLFSGRIYNSAWYSIVIGYDCCGILKNSDTIDDQPSANTNLRLCNAHYKFGDKKTCASVFETSLDTFAKTTLCLLCVALVIEILLLVYTHFKIRKFSSKQSTDNPVIKGIPTYFKDFLCKLIKQSKLNWFPISSLFIITITAVTYISLGLALNYDRIFKQVDVFHLFSNISFGGVLFSDILDELSETYISLALFEVILYIIVVVTYTYKSKFLALCGIILQGIAAATVFAIICRWIYVARGVAVNMEDTLLNNLEQYYTEDPYEAHGYHAMTYPQMYSWNSLMLKMECCGVNEQHNFNSTGWFTKSRRTYPDVQVPSYCCKTKPSNRYQFGYSKNCQENIESDLIYKEGCNTKILERFTGYYVSIFVLGIINLSMHVIMLVVLVMRYRRLESKGQIDKNMNGLWNSIKKNQTKFPFFLTNLTYGVFGLAIVIYGAVNVTNYPTFVISHAMSRINIIDMRFNELIIAFCIGLIITGIFSICSASASIIASIKSNKEGFFIYASFIVAGLFLKIILLISWIFVSTEVNSKLASVLENFYSGRHYLPYWNETVTELRMRKLRPSRLSSLAVNLSLLSYSRRMSKYKESLLQCCYEETDSCTDTVCAKVIENHFNTFTAAALTITSLMILAEVANLVLANMQVRRLSVTQSEESLGKPDMKGIPTYLINNLKAMKAESRLNIVSLSLHGILFVIGLAFILFGLDAMHDEYFTEKDVEELFDRLTFVGRSFSTTMKYYGIGFICVGLIEIVLSVTGTVSQCFTSKVLISSVITIRACFVLSLFIMLAAWINIHVEVAWNLFNELIADLRIHYAVYGEYSHLNDVNYWQIQSVGGATWSWNALFTKFRCCGVDGYRDFTLTAWYNLRPSSSYKIPVYCCETTERYITGNDNVCQEAQTYYYTTGCSDVVRNRFDMYSIVLYVTISVFILIQIFQLVLLVIRLVDLVRRKVSSFGDDKFLRCCMTFAKGLVIDQMKGADILDSIETAESEEKYDEQNVIPESPNSPKIENVQEKKEKEKSKKLKRRQSTNKVTPNDAGIGTGDQKNNADGVEDISTNKNIQIEDVQDKVVKQNKETIQEESYTIN